MRTRPFDKTLLAAGLILALLPAARPQDAALLDLLVRKKILTPAEAKKVRADVMTERPAPDANSKVKVGSWVQEMSIGGDLRIRYQYDNIDFQVAPANGGGTPSGAQRSRVRLRLRLHDDFKLNENWFGGVELATNPTADSSNQTLGSGFGKYGIYISKAYLGWTATDDWLTLEAGKVENPFYTTPLVWDPDINPDGFVQTLRIHKMFATRSHSNGVEDGKTFVEEEPAQRRWELTLNLGEFIFSDNVENGNASGLSEPGLRDNDLANDAWLFEAQLVGSYKFKKNFAVSIAPAVMSYNAARIAIPAGTNSVQFSDIPSTTLPSGAISYLGESRDLIILTAPGDISFKLGSLPAKFYWDFAWNARGEARANDIYGLVLPKTNRPGEFQSLHAAEDDFAYLIGLELGQNKAKGDWSLVGSWRQTGLTAVDPNVNDNDFALGYLNTRGLQLAAYYNLNDFAVIGATYYYAWNLRDNLLGGFATNGPALANANVIQVFELDLRIKF